MTAVADHFRGDTLQEFGPVFRITDEPRIPVGMGVDEPGSDRFAGDIDSFRLKLVKCSGVSDSGDPVVFDQDVL